MSSIATEKKGMIYPAMSKLTARVPNRYMLVNVVARRARQIAEIAEEDGVRLDEKSVTLAIDEVALGKIDAAGMDLCRGRSNFCRSGAGNCDRSTGRCSNAC